MKTDEIIRQLPLLMGRLLKAKSHNLEQLTKKTIEKILGKKKCSGVYAISMDTPDNIVYIGRSKNLIVRLGTDHRATQKNQATLTNAVMKEYKMPSMVAARKKLYSAGWVRFIEVDDVTTRALLEIYVATELETKFNTFIEH